jgi:hypothetical protein
MATNVENGIRNNIRKHWTNFCIFGKKAHHFAFKTDSVTFPNSERSVFDRFISKVLSDLIKPIPQPLVNTEPEFEYYKSVFDDENETVWDDEELGTSYAEFILKMKTKLLPQVGAMNEKGVWYVTTKRRTLLYYKGLLWATQKSETYNYGRDLIKQYQLLPEAASYIPMHFDIDSCALNAILVPNATDRHINEHPITHHQQQLWDCFFRTRKAVFRDTQLNVDGNYIRVGQVRTVLITIFRLMELVVRICL